MIKFIKLFVLISKLCGASDFVTNLEDISANSSPPFRYHDTYNKIHLAVLQEEKQRWTFPDIENLNEYIRPFQDLNCLIIISNFQGVNLFPKMEYPLVLKQPFPVAVTVTDAYFSTPTLDIAWGLISGKNHIFNCSFTKFLSRFSITSSIVAQYCSQIIHTEYIKQIRPWNCGVRLEVYPPIYSFLMPGYPEIFLFGVGAFTNFLRHTIPSPVPPVNFLVYQEHKTDIATRWTHSCTYLGEGGHYYMSYQLYLTLKIYVKANVGSADHMN